MKGRILGIVFLVCLVIPVVTTMSLLHFQKRLIRKEVKHRIIAGIDREELVLLRFTEEESKTVLHWKHSKEFEYDQQMYDIVESEHKGDTIYYWCWWDNKETKLNKHLDSLLAFAMGKDPKSRENQKRLSNFNKTLFCEEVVESHLYSILTVRRSVPYRMKPLVVSYPPPIPPPQIA